jgi:hypothetical protein
MRSPNKGTMAFAGPNGYGSKSSIIRVAVALANNIHIKPIPIAIILIGIVVSGAHVYDSPAVFSQMASYSRVFMFGP